MSLLHANKLTMCFASAILAILFALTACTDNSEKKRDISPYYFPLDKIENRGIVYAYEALKEKSGIKNTEYYYVQKIKTDSGDYVVNTYYDPTLTQGMNTVERVVSNGTVLDKIFFYERDTVSGKRMPLEGVVESGNSFPFLVTDSTGLFLYSVKFHPLYKPDTWNYVIRNKRFHGDARSFNFKGQALKTIKFKSKEVIGSDSEGAAELEGKGEQLYAKGLGLVYYRKDYKGFKQEYRLVDTFGMDELLERARAKFLK